MKFTGHGYQGNIGAASNLNIAGLGLNGNVIGITLTPQP